MKPKEFSADETDRLVRSVPFSRVADWLNAYIVINHHKAEELRRGWMTTRDPMTARAERTLTAARVAKSPVDLDLPGLLDRIESELAGADPSVQWTMNNTPPAVGVSCLDPQERHLQ